MRTRFHQGLDELKQKLLAMGGMAEQAVDRAVPAPTRHATSTVCQMVLARRDPDQRRRARRWTKCRSICSPCSNPWRSICASFSPCIKINADLERVGDQAVNIAERVMDLVMLS